MPRSSRADAALTFEVPDLVELRHAELDGYTVTFGHFKATADPAPLYQGLPDDRCQCPHWGYVLRGKVVLRYADHDETFLAGDAFYGAPGHLPLAFAGSEVIEFSPTELAQQTDDVVGRNMVAGVQPL